MYDLNICRLCKSKDNLVELNEIDGDENLYLKVSSCLEFQIQPDDGLPTWICKNCRKKVNKFYKFKQKCLKTDSELRVLLEESEIEYKNSNCSALEDHHIQSECGKNEGVTNEFDNRIVDQSFIQCEFCGDTFVTKTEYKNHLSSHGETKIYNCKFCTKRFTRADSTRVHMRSHFGIKPFICEYCGKSSTKRQDLLRHMRIHSDDRNYECFTCGRRFKRSGDLSSHIRTHTGARPYVCNICGKAYTSHSGLKKHDKSHKGQSISPDI